MMKNLIQTTFITGVFLTLLAFTNASESDFIGTYGVSENDPTQIELKLNEDNTFTYHDFSNPAKKIDVKGHWKVKNKQIFLESSDAKFSFHSKWKIAKDGMIAKSRKGMTFYTLVRK